MKIDITLSKYMLKLVYESQMHISDSTFVVFVKIVRLLHLA